jgi:hypothetical protein
MCGNEIELQYWAADGGRLGVGGGAGAETETAGGHGSKDGSNRSSGLSCSPSVIHFVSYVPNNTHTIDGPFPFSSAHGIDFSLEQAK